MRRFPPAGNKIGIRRDSCPSLPASASRHHTCGRALPRFVAGEEVQATRRIVAQIGPGCTFSVGRTRFEAGALHGRGLRHRQLSGASCGLGPLPASVRPKAILRSPPDASQTALQLIMNPASGRLLALWGIVEARFQLGTSMRPVTFVPIAF